MREKGQVVREAGKTDWQWFAQPVGRGGALRDADFLASLPLIRSVRELEREAGEQSSVFWRRRALVRKLTFANVC